MGGKGPYRRSEIRIPHDHREIVELSFARCLGRGELKKAGNSWKRLENILGLDANTSPKSLSNILEHVGSARGSQDMLFERIRRDDERVAVGMSVFFSKAKGATLCKKEYNRFWSSTTHVNLLLVCGVASGIPQYMRVVPGNEKEGSAVSMLDE